MDVREKLVEILKQAPFEGKVLDEWWWEEKIRRIADHLISNGVTVHESSCPYCCDNGEGRGRRLVPLKEERQTAMSHPPKGE